MISRESAAVPPAPSPTPLPTPAKIAPPSCLTAPPVTLDHPATLAPPAPLATLAIMGPEPAVNGRDQQSVIPVRLAVRAVEVLLPIAQDASPGSNRAGPAVYALRPAPSTTQARTLALLVTSPFLAAEPAWQERLTQPVPPASQASTSQEGPVWPANLTAMRVRPITAQAARLPSWLQGPTAFAALLRRWYSTLMDLHAYCARVWWLVVWFAMVREQG